VTATVAVAPVSPTEVNPAGASFVLSSIHASACGNLLYVIAVRTRPTATIDGLPLPSSSCASATSGTGRAEKSPFAHAVPGLVQPAH
jgi:hypothetical protein